MTHDPKSIALSYIEACGRKDFDAVAPLLSPDLKFVGPGNTLTGAAPYLAVLRRIGAVWVKSDVKKVLLAVGIPATKFPVGIGGDALLTSVSIFGG